MDPPAAVRRSEGPKENSPPGNCSTAGPSEWCFPRAVCYILRDMGRQWLLAKRLVSGLKKSKTNTKLVREITIAAKMGDADPANNARLFAAVEKAKKESVPKDAIQRAINKGAGIGGEKVVMEHVVYEGRAPHNVPVIVEVYTDNVNRT